MADYYRVSKRSMQVVGSNLNCPPLKNPKPKAAPFSVAQVPHTGKVFFIPTEIWYAWKEQVQRDLAATQEVPPDA